MMRLDTYLSRYYEEEDMVFVMHLAVDGNRTIDFENGFSVTVNSSNHICGTVNMPSHNEMLQLFKDKGVSFKAIDMLPIYKLRNLKHSYVIRHINTNTLYTF